MYTNPFNRTHCTIRQIIDKFLHVENKNKNSLRRSTSNCSDSSYSSCSSRESNRSRTTMKSTLSTNFHRKYDLAK
ncbi:unnamed protein product [Tenebrio molitor]|nr:unnamed protein product [Tenebrio molitor]